MRKIIIDTDIGDDIDDVLAITMALNSPEVEIVGLTTVFTRADLRAKLAQQFFEVSGINSIPVVCGNSMPLIGEWNINNGPCQYENKNDLQSNYSNSAVEFMIEKVKQYPGQITIVAIGALTNIAEALNKSSFFRENIKKIILMGGVYSYHYNEWNIKCDPEAAQIVFDSDISITMVGLDVTMKCSIEVDKTIQMLEEHCSNQSEFLIELIHKWVAVGLNRPIILHDALVIGILIDSTIVTMQNKLIKVETEGRYTRGMTFCYETPFGESLPKKPNIKVCTDVDQYRFMELFIERVLC